MANYHLRMEGHRCLIMRSTPTNQAIVHLSSYSMTFLLQLKKMVKYGHLWPFIAIYGQLWPIMANYGRMKGRFILCSTRIN